MTPRQKEKQQLLARVHDLMEEAFRLPRSTSSFSRREDIDWELVQLFRKIADLSAGPKPYWANDNWTESTDDVTAADDADALPI